MTSDVWTTSFWLVEGKVYDLRKHFPTRRKMRELKVRYIMILRHVAPGYQEIPDHGKLTPP